MSTTNFMSTSNFNRIKEAKTLKEKTNILYWAWIKSKALSLDDLRVNKFYIYANVTTSESVKKINPILAETLQENGSLVLFPKAPAEIIDIKLQRILKNEDETKFHLSDGSNVVTVTEVGYKSNWVLCDVNLEINRTSEKISQLNTVLDTLDFLEELKKNSPVIPNMPGIGIPSVPTPGIIGPQPTIIPSPWAPGPLNPPSIPYTPTSPINPWKIGDAADSTDKYKLTWGDNSGNYIGKVTDTAGNSITIKTASSIGNAFSISGGSININNSGQFLANLSASLDAADSNIDVFSSTVLDIL